MTPLGVVAAALRSLSHAWRAVLVVLTATLVPLLTLDIVLSVVGAGPDAVMVNGLPWVGVPTSWLARAVLALTGATTIAVTAGALAVVVCADLDGTAVPGLTALRRGVHRWLPLACLLGTLAVIGALGLAATALASGFVAGRGGPGWFGIAVACAGTFATLATALRLALALPAVAVEGNGVRTALRQAWAASRGQTWLTAGSVLLGFLVPILLAGVLSRWLGDPARSAALSGVDASRVDVQLGGVAALIVAAFASATVTVLQRALLSGLQPPAAAKPAVRSRRMWPAFAALALPYAIATGLAAVNPLHAADIAVHEVHLPSEVLALGTGPGMVIGSQTRHTCTDTCVPGILDEPVQAATVLPGGAILATSTFNGDNELRVVACKAGQRCVDRGVAMRWEPRDEAGQRVTVLPRASAIVADRLDGRVVVAAATPVDVRNEGTYRAYELALASCVNPTCAQPALVRFGEVPYVEGATVDAISVAVAVRADGRPALAFRSPAGLWIGTCDTTACDVPQLRRTDDFSGSDLESDDRESDGALAMVATADGGFAVLDREPMSGNPRVTSCEAAGCDNEQIATLGGLEWIGAALSLDPQGNAVVAGRRPGASPRVVLLRCEYADCTAPAATLTLLNPLDGRAVRGHLAIAPHQLVLVYRPDNESSGRLVTCATPTCRT